MEKHRILIVDDEADFRNLLVEAVDGMGYPVDGAESAEAAVELVKDRHYACSPI